jgi:hypothetical protein
MALLHSRLNDYAGLSGVKSMNLSVSEIQRILSEVGRSNAAADANKVFNALKTAGAEAASNMLSSLTYGAIPGGKKKAKKQLISTVNQIVSRMKKIF